LLHQSYAPHQYDNWVVWAGNLSVLLAGIRFPSTLARAFVEPGVTRVAARARVELFVGGMDHDQIDVTTLDARLWTDANQRGVLDTTGVFRNGAGRHLPLRLVCDAYGGPLLSGNNLVFESDAFMLEATGVFSYTAEFSADPRDPADPAKAWVAINEMAPNNDGTIVVSPQWVADSPVVMEVGARKVGARHEQGVFCSGTLACVTAELDKMSADVVYLLPFFKPGFYDTHSGEDVRKGNLGSVYAVQDFFQIDPELVGDPETVDWAALVDQALVQDQDVEDLAARMELPAGAVPVCELVQLSPAQRQQRLGRAALVQLVGRAQLRALTRRAHELGKRVIFDLVLMQTSRDNPLVRQHPEWYVLDEQGRPSIHRIAWLVYSDVALFDLVFNKPLQDYLLTIAPYWIGLADLDGVRIDASQTIDRPFLKQIKNRINALKPDALVLGETLCPLDEAVDIPVDMIYALLVDFHRDMEQAAPLTDFLEEMHAQFAPRTVALAYFENHDSPRATQVWRDKFAQLLQDDAAAAKYWRQVEYAVQPELERRPLLMALLKNLQASVLDATAGQADASNLTYGLEWGSDWGEETRTDFENDILLHSQWRQQAVRAALVRAYAQLYQFKQEWDEIRRGLVYYHRNPFTGGDAEDRVFAYTRYTAAGALVVLHNLDAVSSRSVHYSFEFLDRAIKEANVLLDSYACFSIQGPLRKSPMADNGAFSFALLPLQTLVVRLS
jgi:glycosidase